MTNPAQAAIDAAKARAAAAREQESLSTSVSTTASLSTSLSTSESVVASLSTAVPSMDTAGQYGSSGQQVVQAASQVVASSAANSQALPFTSTIPQGTQANLGAPIVETLVPEFKQGGKEFQHIYAGAGCIMPDGRRIQFGGSPGGSGRYITTNKDEIEYLTELARTPGSQVSEIFRDAEGREVSRGAWNSFREDFQRAAGDAQENTRRDHDPRIAAARNNLGSSVNQD